MNTVYSFSAGEGYARGYSQDYDTIEDLKKAVSKHVNNCMERISECNKKMESGEPMIDWLGDEQDPEEARDDTILCGFPVQLLEYKEDDGFCELSRYITTNISYEEFLLNGVEEELFSVS